MNKYFFGMTMALSLLPLQLAAQQAPADRFRLEPYAGAFVDAYDISPDGKNTGALLGLRLGYAAGERARLTANVGYASSEHVSNPNRVTDYNVFDNNWVLTTVGAEYDVLPGRTSASLGLEVGAGWRKVSQAGMVGAPAAEEFGTTYSAYDVVVPALTVRHALSARTALSLSVRDHMFDVLEGPVDHSPAVTLGVVLR